MRAPDADILNLNLVVLERFSSYVTREGECWIYNGPKLSSKGYGAFNYKYNKWPAHRVPYTLLNGPIPPGMVPDHLCRRPPCVNPWHLEVVTNRENVLRGVGHTAINARKTECPKGHALVEGNIYRTVKGRACLKCKKMDAHLAYLAKKERKQCSTT